METEKKEKICTVMRDERRGRIGHTQLSAAALLSHRHCSGTEDLSFFCVGDPGCFVRCVARASDVGALLNCSAEYG